MFRWLFKQSKGIIIFLSFLLSNIKKIFLTIPDLTLQGVLYLGFIFFILMYSISQRDAFMFQVAIICYLVFGGAFVFSYINLNRIFCKHHIPKFVFAKEIFLIKVTIENKKNSIESFWLTLEDDFYKKEHQSLLSCLNIAPQNSIEKEFMTVMHRRGVYKQFTYRLISTFPFGLFVKESIGIDDAPITVFPAPMDELEINSLLGAQQGSQGSLQIYSVDYQGEFRGMRAFQPGDPIKAVHWAASIRQNQLLIRELEPTSTNKTLIIAHSVQFSPKKSYNHKAFETMLQFLTGYFVSKIRDTSECFYSFSFDQYQTIQVNGENESFYAMLNKLAEAREFKESSIEPLLKCINDNYDFNNIIVVSNVQKELWEQQILHINPRIVCIDTLRRVEK